MTDSTLIKNVHYVKPYSVLTICNAIKCTGAGHLGTPTIPINYY